MMLARTDFVKVWRRNHARLWLFFQPFEKIQIVAVGVAKAHHSCTPTLIRRFAVENQPFGLRFRMDAVNVLHLKTYMVDSQRILKECEIAFNQCWIRVSRLEDEQLRCTRNHGNSAVVLVGFCKTKVLVKPNGPPEVCYANSNVIDAFNHTCVI